MSRYAIETYALGWIVADYSGKRGKFGAAYTGVSGQWSDQPVIRDPFPTKEAAEAFVAKQEQ